MSLFLSFFFLSFLEQIPGEMLNGGKDEMKMRGEYRVELINSFIQCYEPCAQGIILTKAIESGSFKKGMVNESLRCDCIGGNGHSFHFYGNPSMNPTREGTIDWSRSRERDRETWENIAFNRKDRKVKGSTWIILMNRVLDREDGFIVSLHNQLP